MARKQIPQMEPWFGIEEKQALIEYMDEGGWLTEFHRTATFEQMIADYTGAKHCIVVNNGTISLTLGAMACGIEAGDEVIVPNFTMIATPNSVRMFGATPVFVDVEQETLCLDFEKTVEAITARTKAIMLVAANGRYPAAGIARFEELVRDRGIVLIEDSAQALGSRYPDGRHIGTAGAVGSFSFSAPKVISTGQGGCLITDDDVIAERVHKLKDFGREGGGNDIHDTLGFNFKFTELQACVGIEQMKKLAWRVERKREIFTLYRNYLAENRRIVFFDQNLENTTPWFIDTLVDDRHGLAAHLKKHGIGSRVMYPPINGQKAYNTAGEYPISDLVGRKGLWLPSASQLSDDQVGWICDVMNDFYR